MNAKVSKFFRKYCREMELDYRKCKRDWQGVPRPARGKLLWTMLQVLLRKNAKEGR